MLIHSYKIELTHLPSGISASVNQRPRRSYYKNKELALSHLKSKLYAQTMELEESTFLYDLHEEDYPNELLDIRNVDNYI